MASLFGDSPLYPYIKFRLGGETVSLTGDGYYSLGDSMSSFSNQAIPDTVVSLSVSRKSPNGSSNGYTSTSLSCSFTINVFDETAIYVEEKVTEALASGGGNGDCYIEYGWSRNGTPIDGRYLGIKGSIQKYAISFQGPSTELEISGISQEAVSLGTVLSPDKVVSIKNTAGGSDSVFKSGNPSEILKAICDLEGWSYYDENGNCTIDDTGVIEDEGSENGFKDLTPSTNQDYLAYINKVLCGNLDGYVFDLKTDSNGNSVVSFKKSQSPSNSNIKTITESGTVVSQSEFEQTDVEGVQSRCIREYNYYYGSPDNEIISFTPEFNSMDRMNSYSVASIDSNTNEIFEVTTGSMKGENVKDIKRTKAGGKDITTYNPYRVMGVSSDSMLNLSRQASNLMSLYNQNTNKASLELMGDPQISVYDVIHINMWTKYGYKHHTSGYYMVQSVEDSVDGGSFITNLSLIKQSTNESEDIGGMTFDTY